MITLADDGENKKFRIRQMPATKAEQFTIKLMMLAGGASEGNLYKVLASAPYEKFQELMTALLECCSINTDGIETNLTEDNVDGFIVDKNTLMRLRIEAFKFNDFFQLSGLSELDNFLAPEADIKRRA